jgi:hypothetical protein
MSSKLLYSIKVPIVPDYLYHLDNPTKAHDTYNFLAKNCSHNELIQRRDYFVRNPVEFRRILETYCNWTVDWTVNRTEIENKQKAIILKNVRNNLYIFECSKRKNSSPLFFFV